jgi:hypothetical protein
MRKIILLLLVLPFFASAIFAENEELNLKDHVNSAYNISMKYPDGWYVVENNADNDVYYLFVTKEKVEGAERSRTSYILAKVYNAKKNVAAFGSYRPKNVAKEFFERYTEQITDMKSIVISSPISPMMLGKDECYLAELYFKDRYGDDIGVFFVVGFKNDTLLNIIFSAPREKFMDYRDLYLKILKEAVVF